MADDWEASAEAWITEQSDGGDYGRRFVLDGPMLARVEAAMPDTALDLGCGEGRFCRMLRAKGIAVVGIDPVERLLEEARRQDPGGDYRAGRAEALELADGAFDLVVSYLSLIDIAALDDALDEAVRVLRPGGRFLIANLTSFNTAGQPGGWQDGRFCIDHYLEDRAEWAEWRGIRIVNWHRPLERYMQALIARDLTLTHFAEPAPTGGQPGQIEKYRRVPYFLIMEWKKPFS